MGGVAALVFLLMGTPAINAEERHGYSIFGDLLYAAGFEHYDYVWADAPKGGTMRFPGGGTFDNLNPYIRKGRAATGMTITFDTLMTQSWDEPSAQYGLVAGSVDVAEDWSSVTFKIREEARFHDGSPITATDVLFSFETMRDHGAPRFRVNYRNITSAEITGPRSVTFHATGKGAAEPLLIIGQMPIFSEAWWAGRDFESTTLEPVLSSGPYQVVYVDAGRIVELQRVKDYWARDLNVNVGRYNFDVIRYDYFRDFTISLEALKADVLDFRPEGVAKDWATAYDFPAKDAGFFIQEIFRTDRPRGQRGSFFNMRMPLFADIGVREAIASVFDFEWENRVLFYSFYKRTNSYFAESELEATGRPEGQELEFLEMFRDTLPAGVFGAPFKAPTTSGWGCNCDLQRQASRRLEQLGWTVADGRRVNRETGEPLEFDILLSTPAYERVMLPFVGNLRRMGITANLRVVDVSQYLNRRGARDYGMVIQTNSHTLSPGTELLDYYGSQSADEEFSRNYAGIKSEAVDFLIDRIINAESRAGLLAAARALDRVLMWSHYAIPGYHSPGARYAFWDRFARPAQRPRFETGFPHTWWFDEAKARRIEEGVADLED